MNTIQKVKVLMGGDYHTYRTKEDRVSIIPNGVELTVMSEYFKRTYHNCPFMLYYDVALSTGELSEA